MRKRKGGRERAWEEENGKAVRGLGPREKRESRRRPSGLGRQGEGLPGGRTRDAGSYEPRGELWPRREGGGRAEGAPAGMRA